MQNEQQARFEEIRELVDQAQGTLDDMRHLADNGLQEVDHDSSLQAACLQKLQQRAGEAVQALTDAAEAARHARSYQAQMHNHYNQGDAGLR